MSAHLPPGSSLDRFISSLPSQRDAMLRANRRRILDCQCIRLGDKVASTAIPVIGDVVSVTPKRFTVRFPFGPQGACTKTFRREDGRSVGGRVYAWATPQRVAPTGTEKKE